MSHEWSQRTREISCWARGEEMKTDSCNYSKHFVYYINTLQTRRRRLNSRFKKRTRCHSFMVLNRANDVSAADWQSQTHVKYHRNFSCEEMRFSFSVEEIPVKHTNLYNKTFFSSYYLLLWFPKARPPSSRPKGSEEMGCSLIYFTCTPLLRLLNLAQNIFVAFLKLQVYFLMFVPCLTLEN